MTTTFGFLRGNHTVKTFKSYTEAYDWLNDINNYNDIKYFEMAFVEGIHLHKQMYESTIDYKNRSLSFFKEKLKKKHEIPTIVMHMQDYLIP